MNIHEYKFLLHSFKAVFAQLSQDPATAAEEIKKATEMKEKFGQDPVKFRANVNLPAQIQHQGMLTSIKSQILMQEGKLMKSINVLTMEDTGKQTHPSCIYTK